MNIDEKDYWKVFAVAIIVSVFGLWTEVSGYPMKLLRSPLLLLVLGCIGYGFVKLGETLWLMTRKKGPWEQKDD